MRGRARRQIAGVFRVGHQELLHEAWFCSFAPLFAALFIDICQVTKVIVDVASHRRRGLRIELAHDRVLSLGPIRRLKRVVDIPDD